MYKKRIVLFAAICIAGSIICLYSNFWKRVLVQYHTNAMHINPHKVSNYVALCRLYAALGKNKKLAEWVDKGSRLELRHQTRESLLYFLKFYWRINKYEKAAQFMKDALRLGYSDSGIYYHLGDSYLRMGSYKEAAEAYQKGMQTDPNDGRNYYGMGTYVRVYEHNLQKAQEWLERAYRVDPDNLELYLEMGAFYLESKEYDKAIEILSKGASMKVPIACPYQGLGMVYMALGFPKIAEENYKKAIHADPFRESVHYDVASFYVAIGELDKAETYLDQALALNPLQKWAEMEARMVTLKGFIYLLRREYDSAETLFKRVLMKDNMDVGARIGMGHILNSRKKYKEAEHYFQHTEASDDPRFNILQLLGLGWVNANQHRHGKAIEYYKQIIQQEPVNMLALLGMGTSYVWLKEYDNAATYFNKVLEIDPRNEYALAQLGTVCLNKGEYTKAQALFQQSLKKNSTSHSCPYEGLGLLYLQQGKEKEAEEFFEKAIAINPDIEYKKYNGLARIYMHRHEYDKAAGLLRKAIENYPDNNEAQTMLQTVEQFL